MCLCGKKKKGGDGTAWMPLPGGLRHKGRQRPSWTPECLNKVSWGTCACPRIHARPPLGRLLSFHSCVVQPRDARECTQRGAWAKPRHNDSSTHHQSLRSSSFGLPTSCPPSATKACGNAPTKKATEEELPIWRWRWIGLTLRKPASDTTRQSLRWNPRGARKRGRPRNTWRRDLEADAKMMGHTRGLLEALARDRDARRTLVGGLSLRRGNRCK